VAPKYVLTLPEPSGSPVPPLTCCPLYEASRLVSEHRRYRVVVVLAVAMEVVVVKAVRVLKATVVMDVLDVTVAVEDTLPRRRTSVLVMVMICVAKETERGSVTVTAERIIVDIEILRT
jgi:hypothetical protein